MVKQVLAATWKGARGKKGVQKAGVHLTTAGVVGGVVDGSLEYASRRMENPEENQLMSIGAGAATAAGWMFLPGLMWAKTGYDVAKGMGESMESYQRKFYEDQAAVTENRGRIGGGFVDTEFGYTSRQRALTAIQNSRLNARSALSNEARSLHHF